MINDKYIYLNIKDKSFSYVLEVLTQMASKDYFVIDLNKILQEVTNRSINALTISLKDKTIKGYSFTDSLLNLICTPYEVFTEKYLKDPTYDLHTLIKKILYEIL